MLSSGVRYRKISYHNYCTLYLAIQYIYSKSLSMYIYTDDTCTIDVLEVQNSMVHTTLHTLLTIKITVYNDILGTSFSKIYQTVR